MCFWNDGLWKMSKKSAFRGYFNKEHGKRAKTLFKSERPHIYHIYWSLWRQLGLKKSSAVICKVLGFFTTPLTAKNKYSLLNRGNLLQHFKMQFSENWKTFSQYFFLHFLYLDSFFNIFKKKMTLTADVFLNLRTPKHVIR